MPNYEFFNSQKKYEMFVFLLIFRCCFMDPNLWGKQVSFQNKKCQAHASTSAAYYKEGNRCPPAHQLLTVYNRIKVHMDLQSDKSPVLVKGPSFP
jgi:hypothetical protein